MPTFAELDLATALQILQEAGNFASKTLAPLNINGDLEGCRFEKGRVSTPRGFAEAYRQFQEAGWPALCCDIQTGGQGLPLVLNAALYEMLNATNHAWTMYPGVAHGAYECLNTFAPEHIKALYLPRIVSGEWLTTMCLTEPQAGSDVGLVRARAEPAADGVYEISGTKIFISGGEHDLTENIVHLVLARLPDAPAGTRGISLFLVPKLIPTVVGMERNSVYCDGIERKMGLKGSSTCVMTFDAAKGWMIGEPDKGLSAMFVMMNAARLNVGLQGLGHAEMAYQNGLRYAHERLQMRAVARPAEAQPRHSSGADKIALHPPTRRLLMTLRAMVEGQRALGYWAAHLLDVAANDADETRRVEAHDLASLLTPIVKSFFTEKGFTLTSDALQIWGGYGYIQGSGIEQSVRDSRIAMIYEGTNEIQAIDFTVRKVIADGGKIFNTLLKHVQNEADRCSATANCEPIGSALTRVNAAVVQMKTAVISEARSDPEMGYRVAGDFLQLTGYLLLGMFWAKSARIAAARASTFYRQKLETAHFYFDFVFPQADSCLSLLEQRRRGLPWV